HGWQRYPSSAFWFVTVSDLFTGEGRENKDTIVGGGNGVPQLKKRFFLCALRQLCLGQLPHAGHQGYIRRSLLKKNGMFLLRQKIGQRGFLTRLLCSSGCGPA